MYKNHKIKEATLAPCSKMPSCDRSTLLRIDNHLSTDDLYSMVFLCRDIIGISQLGHIHRAINLTEQLERKFGEHVIDGINYTWIDLFKELLFHAGRMDLLKFMGSNKDTIKKQLKVISLVNSFTLLLFEIRQAIIPEDLDVMKFQYYGDTSNTAAITDPLDFFMALERQVVIGPNVLEPLEEMIESTNRWDILRKIQKYKSRHPDVNERARKQRPWQYHHQEQIGELVKDEEMPRYEMNAVPRGYCIIFNNSNFYQGHDQCKELKDRKGTDVDKSKLEHLFTKLHFVVSVHENLTGKELKKTNEYAARNHHALDCLVVIILSHGLLRGVYGADSEPVMLRDLTTPFRPQACPSLANKPKIFIVQACQGTEQQPSVPYYNQPDAPDQSLPELDYPHQHHQHCSSSPDYTLPNEADFLIAYATVEGFVSYR